MRRDCDESTISQYEINNREFVNSFSFTKQPCCGSPQYQDYSYKISKHLIDFDTVENKPNKYNDDFMKKIALLF